MKGLRYNPMKLSQKRTEFVSRILRSLTTIVKNVKGFTMIETLLSLFIQVMIIMLVPLLIHNLRNYNDIIYDDHSFQIELMIKDVAYHFHHTPIANVHIHQNRIDMVQKNETLNFKIVNKKLIKSINNKGNITLCNNVKSVIYKIIQSNHLIMHLTYLKGDKWHAKEIII